MTEGKLLALPKDKRAETDRLEEELRGEITRYLEKTRALERVLNEGLAALRRQVVKPLLEHELQEIRNELRKQIKDTVKLDLAKYVSAGAYRDAFVTAMQSNKKIKDEDIWVHQDLSCYSGSPQARKNSLFERLKYNF